MKNEVAIRVLKQQRAHLHSEYERIQLAVVDMKALIQEHTREVESIRVQINAIQSALCLLESQENYGKPRKC